MLKRENCQKKILFYSTCDDFKPHIASTAISCCYAHKNHHETLRLMCIDLQGNFLMRVGKGREQC